MAPTIPAMAAANSFDFLFIRHLYVDLNRSALFRGVIYTNKFVSKLHRIIGNMNTISFIGLNIPSWAAALILFMGWVSIGWTIKKAVFIWLNAISKKSDTPLDDVLIDALDWPVTVLVVVSAVLYIPHLFFADKLPFITPRLLGMGLKALVIFSAVLFVNKLLLGLIRVYAPRFEVLRVSGGFTEILVRILVFSAGGLILLDSFGISITPILASLGLGSLAIALALQPTLENLISGFQIILDRPILPGHFVKLESGEEGYVDHIGWRSTWIRLLSNNMVIVPNKQIVNSRVLNYYYPSKELAVLVEVGVHYSSDLKKVEQVTCEVGRDVMKRITGAVDSFEPFIRFHTFADSSINFSVILRGKEFVDNYFIKHEFIKALQERYAKEGITIPYPIRAINTEQEKTKFVVTHNGEPQSGKAGTPS